MRYRTRLLLVIVGLVALTGGLLAGLTYMQARRVVFEQIRATVLSIATATAVQIDGDRHEVIRQPGDQRGEAYRELEALLRGIRDSQRRDDVDVAFIYTMRLVSKRGEEESWRYVVDAEESGDDKSSVGDPVEYDAVRGEVKPLSSALLMAYADDRFTIDEFGVWLSAQAPIRNSAGQAVAVLGVDLAAADVVAMLDELRWRALVAFLFALVAGAGFAILLSRAVTRPLDVVKAGVDQIAAGELDARIDLERSDEFGGLARAVNEMAKSLEERDMLKKAFARYVSRTMAEKVMGAETVNQPRGMRQNITVLFSDVRGFRDWSESLPPDELVAQLNEYFSHMVEIVLRHEGTLDKFTGDGLMAIFAEPLKTGDQERQAVLAMLEMHEAVAFLGRKWESEGRGPLMIGVGVHSGSAVIDNVDAQGRLDYAAIGRTVNIASRLEVLAEDFETAGLISEAAVEAVRDRFEFESLGPIDMAGEGESLEVFTLPELKWKG